ncbi:hypothetical protein ABIC47_002401 [Leifsonia sp. 563]|uniref:hypothetical protein n=1 Tax=Leifsonia sp. 563 TaxID=3156412 RepID=UPI003392A41B
MNERSMSRRVFLGATALTAGAVLGALDVGPVLAAPTPRLRMGDSPNASPDGTTIPSATSITDNGGDVWTVSGGVIYRNGSTVGVTYDVALLLWYGGVIYCVNTSGQWYAGWNDAWLHCTDPRIPLSVPAGMLYGMNGHHDTPQSPALIASLMTDLGCTVYRVNCTDDPASLGPVTTLAQSLGASGITVLPVIDSGLEDSSGALYASEDAAYASGRSIGEAVANALTPHGVTMFECGNELTRNSAIILPEHEADAGTKLVDFDNDNWPLMRGLMRGLIDGVKSVQPGAQCGINFCKSDVAAADGLWEGWQPDGSIGHPPVRWDLTTWHNYEGDGDIFRIGTDGAGPSFDLPIYCKARYGVPFLLTEWNSDPNQSQSHRASYIAAQLAEFGPRRNTEGFLSSMFYELDGGTQWGLVDDAGTHMDPPYSAYRSFVAAHPDV